MQHSDGAVLAGYGFTPEDHVHAKANPNPHPHPNPNPNPNPNINPNRNINSNRNIDPNPNSNSFTSNGAVWVTSWARGSNMGNTALSGPRAGVYGLCEDGTKDVLMSNVCTCGAAAQLDHACTYACQGLSIHMQVFYLPNWDGLLNDRFEAPKRNFNNDNRAPSPAAYAM